MLVEALDRESRGHIADAQELYRTVLEQQPDNYQALTRFSLLEYRIHNYDSAVSLLKTASGIYPNDHGIWFNLGVSYRAIGQAEKAIPCFEKVIQLNPARLQAYIYMSEVYQQIGDIDSALVSFQRASKLNLLDSDAQCQYARLLDETAKNRSGKFDDAIDAYQSSITMDPENPEAPGRLGFLLEKINRVDEAEQAVLQGLPHTPSDPLMNLVLAKCKYHQKKYAEGIACLRNVNINACAPQLQVLLYAEMAALHDKSGEYDHAFKYISMGNLQANNLWSAYSGETTTYLDKTEQLLKQVEQMEYIDAPACIHDDYKDPVFLIGFPRSGTTLLDQVLDSHECIHTMEEVPVFNRLLERTGDLGGRYPSNLEELSDSEIAELRNAYFEEISGYIEHPRDSLFIDKLPLNICNILLINRIFPAARYILAIRHPCDACLSCFMQSFSYTMAMASFYRLDTAVRLYDRIMRLWVLFEDNLDLDFHMIRYEDVVKDLEKETRQLLTFLGVSWDDNMLNFDRHARERVTIKTPSYRQVREPIYRTSLNRWKHYQRHFEPLLPVLQPYIDRFGYGNRS